MTMRNLSAGLAAGILAMAAVAVYSPMAFGQAATTQPAAAGGLVVSAEEVSGNCQRLSAGGQWAAVKNGDRLDEQTVLRTGFGSTMTLRFADNSVVKVSACSKVGISQFRREGALTRTALGLKYGSLRAEVERAKGPNDFEVATPAGTLAVRGTTGELGFSADLGLSLLGESGTWEAANNARHRRVGGGERTNNNLDRYADLSPALHDTQLGPLGLTDPELDALLTNGGGRGIFGFTGSPADSTRRLSPAQREFNIEKTDGNGEGTLPQEKYDGPTGR